ncbi:MAG: nickel pincer cofactor biosynthesis protein LarC [Ruminococcus sp.]|nr:nickel pincer cofactor biosynthesis protein LarC [Ruminococcus sp.]MBR1751819.1 nickel pincer cofactor biosynthesis protein LarC [Ruminococcus sp.]
MRTLYLECSMGAAGDMLTAALVDLVDDKEGFINKMNSLGLPGVKVRYERVSSCGVWGGHISVTVDGHEEHSHDVHAHEHHEHNHHDHEHEHHHDHHEHEHHHSHTSVSDIRALISKLDVSEKVKSDALAVYGLIAEAESAAHNKPVDQIHFHEVGTLDAVADVVGVCLLIEQLAPDRIAASPVHVGFGHVHCAHGVLPVPAPATAHILKGIPTYSSDIEGELCTPTGAALLRHFCTDFCTMPTMAAERIGYGIGSKEFKRMNCVRAFLGQTQDTTDEIYELSCNLDDMTGEDIAFAVSVLLEHGALDVFTTPTGMKKSRPGIMLTVLCKGQDRQKTAELIFKHTATIGIREHSCTRYTLERRKQTVKTKYGDVRVKISEGYGVKRIKPEHDDIERLARENGASISEIKSSVNPE